MTWLWKDGTVLWVMATGLVVALIYQGLYASTLDVYKRQVLGHIPDDELTLEVVSGGENSRNPA